MVGGVCHCISRQDGDYVGFQPTIEGGMDERRWVYIRPHFSRIRRLDRVFGILIEAELDGLLAARPAGPLEGIVAVLPRVHPMIVAAAFVLCRSIHHVAQIDGLGLECAAKQREPQEEHTCGFSISSLHQSNLSEALGSARPGAAFYLNRSSRSAPTILRNRHCSEARLYPGLQLRILP